VAKGLTAFRNRRWRIAVAMLLAVVCCAMSLPIPRLSSVEKDRSEPYPCINRACGCASAEQCWKQCCCFTNSNHNTSVSDVDMVCVNNEHSSACCDAEATSPIKENAAGDHQNADAPAASYFCGIAALECQGLTSLWQIFSMTLLPEKSGPEIMGEDLRSKVSPFDLVVCSCDWPPPEPPPRIGVAGFRAVLA
jgi:hypothetical protein